MIHFSIGDWVAIGFGCIGLAKWSVDLMVHWSDRSGDKRGNMWDRINRADTALAAHEAADRVEFGWIKDEIGKMNRKLDNLQAQMRNLATGSNNRFMEGPAE